MEPSKEDRALGRLLASASKLNVLGVLSDGEIQRVTEAKDVLTTVQKSDRCRSKASNGMRLSDLYKERGYHQLVSRFRERFSDTEQAIYLECNPYSPPFAMLSFLYFFVSNIQLSTIFYNSLSVRHTNQLPCLLLPFEVFLVDIDITTLPVYHQTLACNHYDMAEAVVGDIPTSAGMEKCKCVASRSRPKTDKCQRGSTN